jgi:hypothetical protein
VSNDEVMADISAGAAEGEGFVQMEVRDKPLPVMSSCSRLRRAFRGTFVRCPKHGQQFEV